MVSNVANEGADWLHCNHFKEVLLFLGDCSLCVSLYKVRKKALFFLVEITLKWKSLLVLIKESEEKVKKSKKMMILSKKKMRSFVSGYHYSLGIFCELVVGSRS